MRAFVALVILWVGLLAPSGTLAQPALHAGPMLGYITQREASVWVQTDPGTQVALVLQTADAADRALPAVQADDAGIATVIVPLLEPGTAYRYTVSLNGTPIVRPYPTAFTTQPLWQWRTDPPEVTVAIGSCYYRNDAPYDRPGRPYGGDPAIFERIADLNPNAMVWLGDNVYLREVDWHSPHGIRYRFSHARQEPALQRLLATAAHYATWDDHDFGPNDSDRSYTLKGATLDAHTRFWPAPQYGLPDVPGVFQTFEIADAQFFLLDNRYHRSPNATPADAPRTLLGQAQLDWLIDALTFSRAPFKIIGMGGQMLNPNAIFETYINVAPEEREYLLNEIARRRIDGVVFISGDRHHTELNRLEREGTYALLDFTSSPLTAGPAANPRDATNPLRLPETFVTGQQNFGTLTFSGPRTDRVLTMRTYTLDGSLAWEYAVRANDLRTPR